MSQAPKMHQRVWHGIIPCPGIDHCEFYKPGEVNHPLQHEVSKVVNEAENTLVFTSSDLRLGLSNSSSKRSSGTFLNNLAPVPFDPKLDPPQITACFNCWHRNHQLKDCYLKKKNNFCSNCGRKYVEIENCPRCKKAYYEYLEEQEHIQAKIEMYGDAETANYYERRKEPEKLVPAKKKSPQRKSTEKKDDFWSGTSYSNDSKTKTNIIGFLSANGKESKDEDKCNNNYKNVSTSLIKEFKTINLNDKEKDKQETFSISHCMMDSDEKKENYEEHIKTNKFDTCTENTKLQSDQFNCEGLKKIQDNFDSHNSVSLTSNLEDENEDLEDMIFVDEDDESAESNAMEPNLTEESNQAYQHLLSRIKNLPEGAQKVALRCFLNSQKKHSQV